MEYCVVYQVITEELFQMFSTDLGELGDLNDIAATNARIAEAFQQKVNQKLSEGFQRIDLAACRCSSCNKLDDTHVRVLQVPGAEIKFKKDLGFQ